MRTIRALLALFFGLFLIGGIASAIAAAYAKGRMESHGDEDDDEVDLVSIYESREFLSRAKGFQRGSVLNWFGGGSIDLRGATLDPAGASLVVRSILGGIRLVVPASWPVERDTIGFIGGVGDARNQEQVDHTLPVLHLEGWSVLGGIAILSEAPDLDAKAASWAEAEAVREAGAVATDATTAFEPATA